LRGETVKGKKNYGKHKKSLVSSKRHKDDQKNFFGTKKKATVQDPEESLSF